MEEILLSKKNLNLPDWGPYSKHYAGISKIINDDRGSMLDFIFCPGYMRGKVIIPDVNFESGYHHWQANSDLSYFSYRYELQWKDEEFADVELFAVDEESRLAKITFVNNTDFDKEYVCTIFSVLMTKSKVELELNYNDKWIGGEDYYRLDMPASGKNFAGGDQYESKGSNNLGMGKDGLKRGIIVDEYMVNNKGLGNRYTSYDRRLAVNDNSTFLMNNGTIIRYKNSSSHKYDEIYLHLAMSGIKNIDLHISVDDVIYNKQINRQADEKVISFKDFQLINISLIEKTQINNIEIKVDNLESSAVDKSFVLDGILLTTESDKHKIKEKFIFNNDNPRFEVSRKEGEQGVKLNSNIIADDVFLFSPDERQRPPAPYSDCTITNVYNSDLSGQLLQRKLINDSLTNWYDQNCIINMDGKNHFAGYNIAPVVVPKNSSKEIYFSIVSSENKVRKKAKKVFNQKKEIENKIKQKFRKQKYTVSPNSLYEESQQSLMTQLCTNLTYPVLIGDKYYKTYTPGKRWGGLFTWDSGMHGIGLLEYYPEGALDIVEQYLVEEEKKDIDLVLHGTPLPLHIYLINEIYQKHGNKDMLKKLYPRLKKYYNYLAGLSQNSNYDKFETGLLSPYDDCYNSFGVDDYPPQHFLGLKGEYDNASPVSTTAHAIRAGKIMKLFALILDKDKDIEKYQNWINYLAKGLQKYSWDEKSGYFSYVINSSKEKLYYDEKHNYNMGLDGVSPLVSGICTEKQRKRLIKHIMTEEEMWTDYGITTVSYKAPYFRHDGYWNGKIWMPHQWFIWKAMITEGRLQEARKIAETALKVWKRNYEETYNNYEQFDARTGMGEGCHQFGGLSGPAAAFYNTYYKSGHITSGYDTQIHSSDFNKQKNKFEFTLSSPFVDKETGLIIVMKKPGKYILKTDNEAIKVETKDGVIELLPYLNQTKKKFTVEEEKMRSCQ